MFFNLILQSHRAVDDGTQSQYRAKMVTAGQTPNPYQPPAIVAGGTDLSAPTEVTFQSSARLRRHGTDQYLLHWHPSRLLYSSLIMIFISMACVLFSIRYGITALVATMVAVMLLSAAIYTALVQRTRKRIGERLKEFGLASNESMRLRIDADQLRLVHAGGTYAWPYDQIQVHRTKRGLLICPEPLLFILVPRKSDFQTHSYKQFVKVIKSRTAGETANSQ